MCVEFPVYMLSNIWHKFKSNGNSLNKLSWSDTSLINGFNKSVCVDLYAYINR